MKRLILLFFCALFLNVITLYAQPKNFTFCVPVELHLIPADIKTFSVNVTIYDREFSTDGYPIPGSRIGYGGSAQIPIVNGEYADTVIISFNEELRKDPAKAIFWEASLALFGPPGYQGGVFNAMGPDTPYPYDPTKPLVYALTGYIYESEHQLRKIDEPMKHIREDIHRIFNKQAP